MKPILYGRGNLAWRVKGKIHRDGDRPAYIGASGNLAWYQKGHIHREGGRPAHIGADGALAWFHDGKRIRNVSK